MTTDNRTNEPTEAQVEAATRSLLEGADLQVFDVRRQDELRLRVRAALVAAAATAPQAESNVQDSPVIENRGAEISIPVQPSSGVDEEKLTQAIYDELMTDDAVAEVWSNGKVMATARRLVKFAVVEAIGGESA